MNKPPQLKKNRLQIVLLNHIFVGRYNKYKFPPLSYSATIVVFTDLKKRLYASKFGAVRSCRQQGEVVLRMMRSEASSIISASTGASHPTVSGGFSSSTSTVRYYSRFLPFSAQIRHKQHRLESMTARVASLISGLPCVH